MEKSSIFDDGYIQILKLFLFRAVHRKRRHRHHYKMNNEFPSSLHLLAKRESSSSLPLLGTEESLANFATEEIQQLCHMLRPPDIDERQDNFSDVFQYSPVFFFLLIFCKSSCTTFRVLLAEIDQVDWFFLPLQESASSRARIWGAEVFFFPFGGKWGYSFSESVSSLCSNKTSIVQDTKDRLPRGWNPISRCVYSPFVVNLIRHRSSNSLRKGLPAIEYQISVHCFLWFLPQP